MDIREVLKTFNTTDYNVINESKTFLSLFSF